MKLFTENYLLMDLANDLISMGGGAVEETEDEKVARITKENEGLSEDEINAKKIAEENKGLSEEDIKAKDLKKENEGLTPEEIEEKRLTAEKEEGELNFIEDEEKSGNEVGTENLLLDSATELGFELPEGDETWTKDLFTAAVKADLEENKQKLNLDDYDPEVQVIIDFVNNNDGSLAALAMDPAIQGLNEISLMDSESFFEHMYTLNVDPDGTMDQTVLQEQINQRIENIPEAEREAYLDKFKADTVKSRLKPAIDKRISEINKSKSDFRERQVQISAQVHTAKKTKMAKLVDEMTNIAGLTINDKTKAYLKKNIENENLFQEHDKNEAEYQLLGFLFKKFGPKIAEMYGSVISDRENSKYTKGVIEGLSKGYGKTDKGTKRPGTSGSSASNSNTATNNWAAFGKVGEK